MHKITVAILTYNEELHLARCLASLVSLNARVIVIDSFSTDNTCAIAKSCGAEVFQNPFVTQATQFQWAMDNCKIKTDWVLRLDADEYIDEILIDKILDFTKSDGYGHNGAIFKRKHIFLNRWIRHGGRYPLPMLRLFRYGFAHIEQRWMDEHIVLDEGSSITLTGGFYDHNLNSISWFIEKHNKYATREMIDIMLRKLRVGENNMITNGTGFKIRMKRVIKNDIYMRMPYFVRPILYFLFRYIFQLGFLDGTAGFAYHLMQGLWYRCLVDLKCIEAEKMLIGYHSIDDKIMVLEMLTGYKINN